MLKLILGLILSSFMGSKLIFGFTLPITRKSSLLVKAKESKILTRRFASPPWLDAAVRRAADRMADNEQGGNSSRKAAMDVVIEKLAQSSSQEIREIFEQVKQNDASSKTGGFMDPALQRAMQTLEYTDGAEVEESNARSNGSQKKQSSDAQDDEEKRQVFDAVIETEEEGNKPQVHDATIEAQTEQLVKQSLARAVTAMGPPLSFKDAKEDTIKYGTNPTITATALAHTLWRYIVRPGVDTIIDATAGNGHDSVKLAEILFAAPTMEPNAKLICIDIQETACANATEALAAVLTEEQINKHVDVVHGSHAQLPAVHNLGLIVYNLGFLPGSQKEVTTKTESTLASLAQASAMVRMGGLISVMTYPRSNPEEDLAVQSFLEKLAEETKRFRVHQHKQLARQNSPILYTATRIK